MGNWSINPNTLASIDDNGKATFQEHTQDTDYTITYNDGTSGNITKTFTVYACSQPPVDCSAYEFSTRTTPLKIHTSTSIANSLRSLEALTYTIKSSGGFLTGITVVGTSDRWEYMGEFNRTEELYDRTATIEYKNGDGTCVFTQQLVMKGDEEYTVHVKPYPSETSCARGLIADGGPIEFTLRFSIGNTYTLTYTVGDGEEFGDTLETSFGNIIVPFGDVSSFRFNYLSTNEGNILKASTYSNGKKLPQLTTTWAYSDSKAMWDGIIDNLCTNSSSDINRFVVTWDIDTANKTITIYYKYEYLVG